VTTADPGGRRRPSATRGGSKDPVRLGPAEAAIFETFVVPRYLSHFGGLLLEMIVESEQARVVHLCCRTGYPDRGVSLKLEGAHIVGADASPAALQLARAKAATMPNMVAEYRLLDAFPSPLPAWAFSHGLAVHPFANEAERAQLFGEFARLLAPHGQMLVALPLRGSFQELADLLHEYSLKNEEGELEGPVERATEMRPTAEGLSAEVESAGFEFVDVATRTTVLRFRSGRDFFEDPVARLLIVPEVKRHHRLEDPESAFLYVQDAIDKYWSESTFELTVNIGCVTGRRST
jgi:SAM-dependent methyltransferase